MEKKIECPFSNTYDRQSFLAHDPELLLALKLCTRDQYVLKIRRGAGGGGCRRRRPEKIAFYTHALAPCKLDSGFDRAWGMPV